MDRFETLGPFVVDDVIGRGGMGEVWGGRHRSLDLEVAIKVLSKGRFEGEGSRDALASEVQAMASLSHPGIVAILDYGHTTDNEIGAEVPFIVMERAGVTLRKFGPEIANWTEAARLMIEVLEALAHAHSRGLVHRDMKPHNVLRVMRKDGFRWALTDFGLATPVSDLMIADDRRRSGTPRYMSPEQVLGDVREQGSWTDLYGFGCLAAWLLTGSPPFSGEDTVAVMRKHITSEPPPFRWRFPVPADAEDWLRLLLAKDPLDRYRHAADALHGLKSLGAPASDQFGFSGWSDPISEVSDTDATLLDSVEPTRTAISDQALDVTSGRAMDDSFSPQMRFVDDDWAALRAQETQRVPIQRPGLPSDWRGREHQPVSMEVVGASLGLWGMRQVPMVGRDELRDVLWGALRSLHLQSQTGVLVVKGGPGTGKSRLVEWFAQTASECGGAQVMRAKHSDTPGPLDGVDGMLARHLRVVGAEANDVRIRVQSALSEDGRGRAFDAFDVATMMSIVAPELSGSLTVSSTDERVAAMSRYFARVSKERPLILWLDDIHWSPESRALAEYVISGRRLNDVLVVATLREDLEQPGVETWLERLQESDAATVISVGPLTPDEQQTLVTQMLRLSSEAARQVVKRTEGNPLFAVQLVGHWVSQGLLRPGADGFEYVGDKLELPNGIRGLWTDRLERFLTVTASPAAARIALEVAAALGEDVDFREWTASCGAAGASGLPFASLVRDMVAAGLATMDEGGWSFAHGLLRDTVLAEATSEVADLHRWCARALEELYGDNVAFSGRIGRHWARGGKADSAAGYLFEAAEYEARRGDFDAAIAYDDLLLETLDASGSPPGDPRRVRADLRRSRTLLLMGLHDEAAARIEAAHRATNGRTGSLRGEVLWTSSIQARHLSDSDLGLGLARRAQEEFERDDDRIGRARALQKQGEFCRRLGRFDESLESYREAQEIYGEEGLLFESGWIALGLCATLRQVGRSEEAMEQAEKALAIFERLGMGVGIGNVHNEMGEIKRYDGKHAEAAWHYESVIDAWSKAGHVESPVVYLNLSLSWIGQGEVDRARTQLLRLLETSKGDKRRGLRIYVLAALASVGAQTGSPDPAGVVADFEALHREVPIVDLDLASQLTHVATVAKNEDVRNRARALARHQWEKLGRDDLAAQMASDHDHRE